MSLEHPVIPRLNLSAAYNLQASAVQPLTDFTPRPPAAPPKTNHAPSLRQSNTALVPQVTPVMIGKSSDCSDLSYKKILRGRLGVRTHRETQFHPSTPCQPLGSETFRSTMAVLNSRCSSSSARKSKSASSSETNRVSESTLSWYERRSQAISAFGAPLFGFCTTAQEQFENTDKIQKNLRLRPQSSGQAHARPWTGTSNPHAKRPTTVAAIDGSFNAAKDIPTEAVQRSQLKPQLSCESEVNDLKPSHCLSPNMNPNLNAFSASSAVATQLSELSSSKEKYRERRESVFNSLNPTLDQAITELTKGHPLKKFSHASQRVAVKVMRVNSNAELLVDDELHDRVVAIFDGLSSYVEPKHNMHSQDDFVPKYHFNPAMAFHIILMDEECIDVIADSAWTKQCWMSGIRLMLAQMKSKFQSLPTRMPDFDTDDLDEEVVRRMKWLEYLRASTDRLEDERKKKEATLRALELKEKESSDMYDDLSKPVGFDRITDLNNCVARMEFLNIQLDQGGITLKHQVTEQLSTTQVCKVHLQEMSNIVADANSYVEFIRSQHTEVVQQTRQLEIERNCFKDFCFRNRKEIIERLKHRKLFHQQIKNEVEAMANTEKNRGTAILERSRKNETFVDDRQKRHLVANVSLLSFFQGGIDSSAVLSFPKSSSIDGHEPKSLLLLKGLLVSASKPPRGHHLTLKSGFEWMMVTAGMEDLSAFVQRIIAQNAVGVALRAASEASLSGKELKIKDLNAVLSEFSLVHSASDSNPLDDIPDISNLISSGLSRIRDLEVFIRWQQRKEALFIGHSEDAEIALTNIDKQICTAVAINTASKRISVSPDARSSSQYAKRATELSNEPLIALRFANLMKLYNPLLSCLASASIEQSSSYDKLVEVTLHNTRVAITDSDGFLENRSTDRADPALAPVTTSTTSNSSLNVQLAKPKTPIGLVPALPSVQQFKYRKSESKKFKIPRMFEHLEWEKNDPVDSSSAKTVGLYDKNGRRVRIARKQVVVQFVDEAEQESSDDSTGVSDFDIVKVVSKRFIKEQSRRFVQENLSAQAHDANETSN